MADLTVQKFTSFSEFFPFYLGEHRNPTCRVLHFIGTSIGLALLITAILSARYWLIPIAFVQGYGWAWVGHFGFEKNKPASFKQPVYSFIGDWDVVAVAYRKNQVFRLT